MDNIVGNIIATLWASVLTAGSVRLFVEGVSLYVRGRNKAWRATGASLLFITMLLALWAAATLKSAFGGAATSVIAIVFVIAVGFFLVLNAIQKVREDQRAIMRDLGILPPEKRTEVMPQPAGAQGAPPPGPSESNGAHTDPT